MFIIQRIDINILKTYTCNLLCWLEAKIKNKTEELYDRLCLAIENTPCFVLINFRYFIQIYKIIDKKGDNITFDTTFVFFCIRFTYISFRLLMFDL
jgi:hypothetical protein